jgi:hypothetical protein
VITLRAGSEHSRAHEAAQPGAGRRLVQGSDAPEPDPALEAANGVAGQGAGASQQEGGDEEQPAASVGIGSAPEHQRRSGGQTCHPDSRHAREADRRTQQVHDRPTRVVGEFPLQRGEDTDLGDARDQSTQRGESQGAVDCPGRAGLTSPAEHDEREEGPSERDRLARESSRAEPHEQERNHRRGH